MLDATNSYIYYLFIEMQLRPNKLLLRGTPIQSDSNFSSRNFSIKPKKFKEPKDPIPFSIQPKTLNKIITTSNRESALNSPTKKPRDNHKRLSQGVDHHRADETEQKQKSADEVVMPKIKLPPRTDGFRKMPVKVKKCMCGDCEECLKNFSHFLQIFSGDESLPEISAKSWCIWRKNKNDKFLHHYGRRIHKVREIASLTKMITAMVVIDFLKKYDYSPEKITYEIRRPSIIIGGTSAQLQLGEVYTLEELLYGLMLPSGNDAAIALSQAIGLLYSIKNRNRQVNPLAEGWYEQHLGNNNKNYASQFINLMNERCQKLGLLDTHFYNSHGNDAYDQNKNVSTCNEVAKISSQYLKYEDLKKIAQTKSYSVERMNKTWENTNKLLEDGFEGLKTGITETAGPCLAACYKNFIIVVLNSKSMNERWIQVKKLVRWIARKGL